MEYEFAYKNSCLKRYYQQSMNINSGNGIKIYYTIYPLNTYYHCSFNDDNDLALRKRAWRWLLENGYVIQQVVGYQKRIALASDGATGKIHYPRYYSKKWGDGWIDNLRFTDNIKKVSRFYGEPDGAFAVQARCITNRESLRLWCAINIGRDMFTGARHADTPISAWVWGKNVKGLDGLRDIVSVHKIPRGLLISPHPKARLTRLSADNSYWLTVGEKRWRVPAPEKEMIDG